MADFWSKQKEIISIDKNKKEVIKAFHNERQGKEYIELRIYTRNDEEDTDLKPTKKGIVVPKEKWEEIAETIHNDVFDIIKENEELE